MEKQLAAFRSFNRFYTSVIGVLGKHYLNSDFSLTEVRILYELYYTEDGITAKELSEFLKLDKGYLSRILLQFEKKKLIRKERSKRDARSTFLWLTEKGESVFKPLDIASQQQAATMLNSLPERDVRELLKSMEAIKTILGKANTGNYE